MKWETGLLRYDGLDGMGWCFDMGYQRFAVSEGMTMSVRVTDRFEQGRVLAVTDSQLTVELGVRKKWACAFLPNERCETKLAADAVRNMLTEAMEEELRYSNTPAENREGQTDDMNLCF